MERSPSPSPATSGREDPWRLNEIVRRRRLREHAKRPLAVNLAEGLALSEFLSGFRGAAMKRASTRARDRDDIEALEAAHESYE